MKKYINWPENKAIPPLMTVYGRWVIPSSMKRFMPPKEVLKELETMRYGVVYSFDGQGYDLFDHEYCEA